VLAEDPCKVNVDCDSCLDDPRCAYFYSQSELKGFCYKSTFKRRNIFAKTEDDLKERYNIKYDVVYKPGAQCPFVAQTDTNSVPVRIESSEHKDAREAVRDGIRQALDRVKSNSDQDSPISTDIGRIFTRTVIYKGSQLLFNGASFAKDSSQNKFSELFKALQTLTGVKKKGQRGLKTFVQDEFKTTAEESTHMARLVNNHLSKPVISILACIQQRVVTFPMQTILFGLLKAPGDLDKLTSQKMLWDIRIDLKSHSDEVTVRHNRMESIGRHWGQDSQAVPYLEYYYEVIMAFNLKDIQQDQFIDPQMVSVLIVPKKIRFLKDVARTLKVSQEEFKARFGMGSPLQTHPQYGYREIAEVLELTPHQEAQDSEPSIGSEDAFESAENDVTMKK